MMVNMIISSGIHVAIISEYNYDRFLELGKLHSHIITIGVLVIPFPVNKAAGT